MKKHWIILMAALMAIPLVGCGGSTSYNPGTYEGSGDGYGGALVINVTVNEEGKISDIQVKENTETPEVGGAALETLINSAIDGQKSEVDAVAGATVTSGGFNAALFDALSQAEVKK